MFLISYSYNDRSHTSMEREAMLAFLLFLRELPSLTREFSTSWLLLSSNSTDCVCVRERWGGGE